MIVGVMLWFAAACGAFSVVPPVPVPCVAQTEPIQFQGDAADDPAIWVHPQDPAKSLIIGTNKKAGLVVYDLNGRLVQTLSDGRMNNVDVVQVSGRDALILASNRIDQTIAIFRADPATGRLSRGAGSGVPTGLDEVYGLCSYIDPQSGEIVCVVGSKSGVVKFFELREQADGSFDSRVLREFAVGGQAEGMVVDALHGWLYVGEETVGLWRYPLDPTHEPTRQLVDIVRHDGPGITGHLATDVEGVSIYDAGDGKGWIVVSCQGENRFAFYDRVDLTYRGSITLSFTGPDGKIDHVTETDGIHAHAGPLGPRFPAGVLIVQDGNNGDRQNFKIVDWREIDRALGLTGSKPAPSAK